MGGSDLIVQQRRRDEVFQIVVGLLFGVWMVLRTKAPTPRDIEARLEDIAAHVLNACRRESVAALQIQHRFQHRLAVNERAVFLHDRLFDGLKQGILPIHGNRLAEHALQPVWAFEQTTWTREAALGQ